MVSNDRKSKSSRIHVRCDRMRCVSRPAKKSPTSLHWDCIPFLSNTINIRNQFKENPKTSVESKMTEEATKEIKIDVAEMDTKTRPKEKPRGVANL